MTYLPVSGNVSPNAVRLTGDVATTLAALANVTGLSFAVAANTDYRFSFDVQFQSNNAANGIGLALTCPAGATIAYSVETPSASDSVDADFEGYGTASGDVIISVSVPTTNTTYLARIVGVLRNGANAGTLQLQHRATTAGLTTTTKAGSCGILIQLP